MSNKADLIKAGEGAVVKDWVEDGKPHFSRLMRLETLIHIRWIAVFFQTVSICFVAFGLGFSLPLRFCFALVALSAAFNLCLHFYYPRHHRVSPNGAMLIFAADILLLSGLLYFTGGLENPFALLLIAPVGMGATSLFFRSVLLLNILAIICACILALFHYPLPWYPHEIMSLPPLFIGGLLTAIIIALVFISFDSYRLAEEARQFSNALGVTELILQKERYISAMDGLAVAAVHELGTPLTTIQLVASDFHKELGKDERYAEDVGLLLSQTERCRDILAGLGTMAGEDRSRDKVPFTLLLEEVAAPMRNFGIAIELRQGACEGAEPQVQRNPAITYGMGNLVENAVDFARSSVFLRYAWDKEAISLSIIDDGEGFSPDIVDKIGEPYISDRKKGKKKGEIAGGGLGLGLFIAKTLLERMNFKLIFRNSVDCNLGAEVRLIWPAPFDAEPKKFVF